MRRGRLHGGGLVAIAAVIALAACTGAPAAPHRTESAPAPTSAAVPARIANDATLRGDATMRSCTAAPAGWKAGGRLANRSGKAHDYRLTVLFTSDQATVIGVGSATVHMEPGSTKRWTVRARFAASSRTLCVLAGVA